MKRKLALLVLCLLLCLALTGCYTEKDPWPASDPPAAQPATDAPAQQQQETVEAFQTPTPAPAETIDPAGEPGLNG